MRKACDASEAPLWNGRTMARLHGGLGLKLESSFQSRSRVQAGDGMCTPPRSRACGLTGQHLISNARQGHFRIAISSVQHFIRSRGRPTRNGRPPLFVLAGEEARGGAAPGPPKGTPSTHAPPPAAFKAPISKEFREPQLSPGRFDFRIGILTCNCLGSLLNASAESSDDSLRPSVFLGTSGSTHNPGSPGIFHRVRNWLPRGAILDGGRADRSRRVL